MHENVPQPRVVDRAACGGSGRLGHGHRARGRDRPSPCPAAACRHRVRPAAARTQAQPDTVADAQGLAHPGADTGAVADAGGNTDARALTNARAYPVTEAVPVPETLALRGADTCTVTIGGTVTDALQPPIGAQQRSEPRGVH